MPTFKDLKKKARIFVRNKVLTKDELQKIREAGKEIDVPMKKAYETSDQDENQKNLNEMDKDIDDPMRRAAEASDQDEEQGNPIEMDEDIDDPMRIASEISGQDENEDNEEEPLEGVRYLFETSEEKRERIFESRKKERENELKKLRGGGAVAEAKQEYETRAINEKIKHKEEEIAKNKADQAQFSKEMIELSKEGIGLKKLQINLKKENQTKDLQEIDGKIKIFESEIKLKEEEINLSKKEAEILKGELGELKSQSGEKQDEDDTDKRVTDENKNQISYDYLSDEQREGLSKLGNGLQGWAAVLNKIKKVVKNADGFLESQRFQQLNIKELQQIINLQDDDENLEWCIENLKVEIPEPVAKIIEQLDEKTKDSVYQWDKKIWAPYTKNDLVKTLTQFGQKNSPLIKNSESLSKLTEKRLKTFIFYSKNGKLYFDREGGVDLIRDEKVQLMMKDREDKKNMWLSRGASPDNVENHPIYKELTTLFPIGKEMKFFGEGEVNKDNLDGIEKVAQALNTFKLFVKNPFKNFEEEIKEAVKLNGGGIKSLRQRYIDIRKKINTTLELSKKDSNVWGNERNYDLKKYYNGWLGAVNKNFGDEMEPRDIDSCLSDDEYDYLDRIESAVKTLLNEIWENEVSGEEKKLDPKNQAIVKYFSEFLKQSNEVMKPLIRKKVEAADNFEYQAMEEENKYENNAEGEDEGIQKAARAPKPASVSLETISSTWHDLRLKGRMYVVILVQFCNKLKKTIKESEKTKLSELKERIVKQFLERLENHFDTKRSVSSKALEELKGFEVELKKHQEEILSATNMSQDDFDEKIKILKEHSSKRLKEEHYTLPEIK